jgi:CubicO group peptidase (beta-lactamase class C family)
MKIFNFVVLISIIAVATSTDWTEVDALFQSAINNRTFPGGVISIANSKSVLYQKAYGTFSYSQDLFENPIVRLDTKFDIASLTKVTGTLAALVNLFDGKRFAIDDLVTKFIP